MSAELQELRDRVQALEDRLARLGQEDDDTYPFLCAQQFQLADEGPDGEPRLRGSMYVDESGAAFMQVTDVPREGGKAPHAAVLSADDKGPMFALIHEDTSVRLLASLDADGSPRVSLRGPDGTVLIEVTAFDIGGVVSINDTQGRGRISVAAGGEDSDAALLSMTDADGRDAVRFLVPAVSSNGQPAVNLDGWPQWFSESVGKLWDRVHALEG